MHDWNVVVTVHDEGYGKAQRILEHYGTVSAIDYFNILVMRVPDPRWMLDRLHRDGERDDELLAPLSRVMPVYETFSFQEPHEFEAKARQAAGAWLTGLEGKSFHVRMHRRGFKGRLSTMEEERFLDSYLLETLEMSGNPGSITFDDPDAIIAVETIGPRAGLSLWTREELGRYPLLHMD
ncbi:hypothetical protein GMSM_20030 [Geomonas sp. Red276]